MNAFYDQNLPLKIELDSTAAFGKLVLPLTKAAIDGFAILLKLGMHNRAHLLII